MNSGEFPHSEISGSKDVCSSPKLIAAYHVFHRLPVPRHSPCALFSLTVFYALDSPFANEILPFYCCSLLNFNNPLGEIIDFY